MTRSTTIWGDVTPPLVQLQPNFIDIGSVVDKFKAVAGAISKTRAQLHPAATNPLLNVDFLDISNTVGAFKGEDYPYTPGSCP
jgi:hypothetical protein